MEIRAAGPDRKYGTYHDQQDHAEYSHDLFFITAAKVHTASARKRMLHHVAC